MINSGLKETQENRVEIGDFSFDIIEKAIKLCYHPSLVGATTLEDKMQLLQFYDKYDMQTFKNDLQDCLISECDETNVCRLTNAALISNALKLKTKCSKFLHGCLRSQPILDFDLLDKDFALNLLKSAFCRVSEKQEMHFYDEFFR
uniref:BTB domain-containing protein n=1 Tax=Panagrolaimus davidi TaxID=227884 RepID=A0A914QPI7_9BILA